MGLLISPRGITLHLNSLEDTDETIKKINDALTKNALDTLDEPQRQRDAAEKDKDRQFEIDKIRAANTKINEAKNDSTVTNNGKAPVNIYKEPSNSKVFCPECGKEITSPSVKFCPHCGTKIIR